MANLAIGGHPTRGREVIAWLEMLGGENRFQREGDNEHRFYYIDKNKRIQITCGSLGYILFDLEEFEKLYPYKVGDKVTNEYRLPMIIFDVYWDSDFNVIKYNVRFLDDDKTVRTGLTAEELQPYEEENYCQVIGNDTSSNGVNTSASSIIEETMDKTKFPYEIGTRVSVKGTYFDKLATIVGLSYNSCACMQYEIQFDGEDVVVHYPTDLMTPIITEQSMEEKEPEPKAPILSNRYDYAEGKCGYVIPDGYEFDSIKEGFQTEIILKPKKPQYPKTYEECCKVLGIRNDWHLTLELDTPATQDLSVTKEFDYVAKLESLRRLLICRDAYWGIAGEEMGLGKPWEPDWNNDDETKFCIYTTQNMISIDIFGVDNRILAFPTEEMRDTFFGNFEDLIEECKRLL